MDNIDIAFDELPNNKHYKREEDPKFFKSEKTSKFCYNTNAKEKYVLILYLKIDRGLLVEGWRETDKPIMCSYKVVDASFEVWGLQTKVEDFIQRSIRDVLLLGHRQAFTWIDEWYGMTLEDVREYERKIQEETNKKLNQANGNVEEETKESEKDLNEKEDKENEEKKDNDIDNID